MTAMQSCNLMLDMHESMAQDRACMRNGAMIAAHLERGL